LNAVAEKQSKSGKVRVKLVKSVHGRLARHKACVAGLGLRRLNHSVVVADTPENRGMIRRVAYMLQVEEV
jgi:large subunit ribosomal protein L30